MLPLVGSTMTCPEPGLRIPRSSASLIMYQAGRSLMEPPGFSPSSLTQTSAISGSTTLARRTTGVLPMAPSTRMPPL